MKVIRLTLLLAVIPILAQAQEKQQADPILQSVVSSVVASQNSLQVLVNSYEHQKAVISWYENYFKGLTPKIVDTPK